MGKIDTKQRQWLAGLGAIVGGGSGAAAAASPKVAQAVSGGGGASRADSADADTTLLPDAVRADDYADRLREPIEITPREATLKAGQTQQFNASGEFDDGSRDLTSEVEWSSSDDRITIDANGLAKAEPVSSAASAAVTITASYPGSPSAAAKVAIEVEPAKPPVVPAPQVPELHQIIIELEDGSGKPAKGPLLLGSKLQLRATGVYDPLTPDVSTADLTRQVTWSASPQTVATVSNNGLVSAVGIGSVKVRASDAEGRIDDEIELSVEEDRRAPQVPGASLMEIKVSPKGPFEAHVDEVHNFRVTASYNNGKTSDWSKAVLWSAIGDAVEVDKNGVVRMKALGKGSITVELTKPVEALHAPEGLYKGTLARIDVTVLGTASKAPVKLPADGKLSKGAALVLVKHLAYLADPRFMKSDAPEKPGKLEPSGDRAVDGLLQLTAEVVTRWNDLKTLEDARRVWKQVQPRLSALLGEAEKAPVGLKRSELAPALDAVANIASRVKSGPGTVANSQANTHPQTADILPPAVYVKTPYGELFYMQDQAEDFKRLTDPIEATLPQAAKSYAGLEARLKEHEAELAPIAPFLKSPDAAKAEIHKFASNPVITDAHVAEQAKNLAGAVGDNLKAAKRDLDAAKRHYAEAENDLKTEKEVDELREEASKLREQAEHAFEIVGGALEAIIGALENAPSAVFKGVYDVTTVLIKQYGDESLNERAHALEEKARKRKLENFADHIENAAHDVTDAMTTLGEAKDRLAAVEKSFERDRDFAEDGFDATCKEKGLNCKFRFANIRAGLRTAQKTYDKAIASWRAWGGLVVVAGMLAEEYAKLKPLQTGAGYDENMKPTRTYVNIKERNQPVIDRLLKDAKKFEDASARQIAAAEKVTQQLNALRVAANAALANVPRRRGGSH